ncbi:MAG TPA: hypothetical protein VGJ06_09100, partial [Candidatus Acidoferrum sp.]
MLFDRRYLHWDCDGLMKFRVLRNACYHFTERGVLDSAESSAYTMEFLDGPGEQQDRGGTPKWTRKGSN